MEDAGEKGGIIQKKQQTMRNNLLSMVKHQSRLMTMRRV
jgi:hypothetical protein